MTTDHPLYHKAKILLTIFAFSIASTTSYLNGTAGAASVNNKDEYRIPGFPGKVSKTDYVGIKGLRKSFEKNVPMSADYFFCISGPSAEDNIAFIETAAKDAGVEVVKVDFGDLIIEVEKNSVAWGLSDAVDGAIAAAYTKAENLAKEKNCHVFLVFENAQKLDSTYLFEINPVIDSDLKQIKNFIRNNFHSRYLKIQDKPSFVHACFTVDDKRNMDRAWREKCGQLSAVPSRLSLPNHTQRQTIIEDEIKAAGQKPQWLFWTALISKRHSRTSLQKITQQAIEKAKQNNNISQVSNILIQDLWDKVNPKAKTKVKVAVAGGILFISIIAGIMTYKIADKLHFFDKVKVNKNSSTISVKAEVRNK